MVNLSAYIYRLNTKIRSTVLSLSRFELYSVNKKIKKCKYNFKVHTRDEVTLSVRARGSCIRRRTIQIELEFSSVDSRWVPCSTTTSFGSGFPEIRHGTHLYHWVKRT